MAIVTFQNVHVSFAAHQVLQAVEWAIHRGEKVGLIGANGSGKTTLFKLMMGTLVPQIGTVTRSRGLQIAYLPQEVALDGTRTLYAEVCRTFENVQQLEQRVADVASQLAEHHDTDRLDDLMEEYDELMHRLEAAGGYTYETQVKEVLGGLGFSPADYDLPVSALSGGQKCRAALAQLLLQEADLLLLDEPTNHLDIEATRFLERFLAGYHGAAVIVSHDRFLLDRVVDKIADLDQRRIEVYPCNYSDYAETKRIRSMTGEREFEKQQEWLRHQREYAERVKADKRRSRQARGRLKAIERMEERGEIVARPTSSKRKMALQFTPSRRAGDMVLRCENVRKAYGDVVLFNDFNLEIYRGEKVGIVGPNGVGKTTLIKMAMRKVEPDSGLMRLYENLQVAYYDQEHADLNQDHRVIDAIVENPSGPDEARLRAFLARFLFQGDEVYKRVGDLSGGEQSRVMLAKLMYAEPQVLVLDEPTNHLDIPGKEALEEALIAYEGAIILVSHDRYFLDRVINRLLILPERGRYELMTGNWSTYEQLLAEREAARRAELERQKAIARKPAAKKRKPTIPGNQEESGSPYATWSLQRIEDAIVEREEALTEAEQQFSDPEVCRDAARARALNLLVEQIRRELADLNAEWEAHAD